MTKCELHETFLFSDLHKNMPHKNVKPQKIQKKNQKLSKKLFCNDFHKKNCQIDKNHRKRQKLRKIDDFEEKIQKT